MRNAYELPPILAAPNTPRVSAVSGLGTGGSAGVQTPDSGGYGEIKVNVGANFNASGSVAITFPNTPPTLFIAGDDAFGAITQATVGNVVTISWANANFPVTGPAVKYGIHYEWSVSQ